jgi:hypothetical protein
VEGEGAVAVHELVESAGEEGGDEVDGIGDAAPGGGIAGAGPVEEVAEAGVTFAGDIPTMADDGRDDFVLAIGVDVEEGGAFGGAEPFVTITGVEGGADGGEIEGDLGGGVGAVDDDVDIPFVEGVGDFVDGEDEAGGAGDVIDDGGAGVLGDGVEDGVEDLRGRGEGKGERSGDESGAVALGDIAGDIVAGVVSVRGDEDFVAGLEVLGAEDGVDACGGVGDEGEVTRIGMEEGGEFFAGSIEEGLRDLESVRVISRDDDRLVLSSGGDGTHAVGLLSKLLDGPLDIKGVSIQPPGLNGLFLKLTGRELRD